jgi:hypothetical protein
LNVFGLNSRKKKTDSTAVLYKADRNINQAKATTLYLMSKKLSLLLVVGCVAGCALSLQASVDIEVDTTPVLQSADQSPYYASYLTNENVVARNIPERADYGWAAGSFLMVCGLARTLWNSYHKASWN